MPVLLCLFLFACDGAPRYLHSFPTRRSSDLVRTALNAGEAGLRDGDYYSTAVNRCARLRAIAHGGQALLDRKSTRLNSSHTVISYAVFCLKKKNNKTARRLH